MGASTSAEYWLSIWVGDLQGLILAVGGFARIPRQLQRNLTCTVFPEEHLVNDRAFQRLFESLHGLTFPNATCQSM